MQEVSKLEGLKIEQVSESTYRGHFFAVDEDQKLIAMNIKLVCQGERPYQIMSYTKLGDSRTLLTVDSETVWLLHTSG